MRSWFERLPIHRKLVALALLITGVALIIATVGLSIFDVWRSRVTATDDANALASLLAENTAAAVMFAQADAAEEVLASVRGRDVVTRVCLYLPEGQLFAGYARTGTSCPPYQPPAEAWDGATGEARIQRNDRMHGTVIVERSLTDLRRRLLLTVLAGLGTFTIAAIAAYLVAQRVNAAISRPVSELARVVRDFDATAGAMPAIRTAPDELGELVRAFGEMMTRVRTSSDALRRSNDALRVEQAEREAAMVRQRDSEQRFKTLADGSPVLLWVNGPEGCEFVNRAYLDFVGLQDDAEVRGFDWSRFVHPDDRVHYVDAYAAAFRARLPFGAEFRFRRADGEWRWMRSEATPRIEAGAFTGYVGASVDITERRRAEEALRDADRRKDAFLAVLAHELRNPLAPIRTGLELLRSKPDEPGLVTSLRPILERQVSHMVRLIDDLLDVSRITSGKIELQRQATPLKALVDAAIEANRGAIDGAGLALSTTLPDDAWLLDVDPTRFVQVVSNLLHNSTKFTERGGSIAIAAVVEHDAVPPCLALTVRDSGAGISAEMLPRVFEFFVQGEVPGRVAAGLGIGLALARQLVELHGGTIEAHSDGPGAGSAFTIRIGARLANTGGVPVAATDDESRRFAGRRVLVIDDNVDAADTMAALVAALAGTVATAYSGLEGLRRAAEFRPDVILLDIGMPDMDGYETCRRLRSAVAGQAAFIIALTGWGQQRDRDRALAEGFDAHLTKPADPRTLQALVADGTTGRSSRMGLGGT